ncbi:MAG: hypothetical protein HC866_01925 [Leptolyngbyaceae cyanobacterium RU_5_1]|nr:hypothetical protein [Leptolyngbyaceae cyanobacterium RU_5_1]
MRRHKLVALIGVIAIAIAGCASEDTTTTSSPAPSPSEAASPQPSPTTAQPATAQPLVAQRLPTPGPVPGLIQPTNIKERERQIQSETKIERVIPLLDCLQWYPGLQPAP